MLVADAQSLHSSTQELCSLRDTLVEEKDVLCEGLRHLQQLKEQASVEQAAVADAEGKIHELNAQISEKQAELSDQNLKA